MNFGMMLSEKNEQGCRRNSEEKEKFRRAEERGISSSLEEDETKRTKFLKNQKNIYLM